MKSLIVALLSAWTTACPEKCRCDGRKRVYCNNRNFSEIPSDIPSDTKVLYLQGNEISNSDALDFTLGMLTELESLKLYNNKLERMPKLNSKYLRDVHLNQNRIKSISAASLENVPNLSEIILDDNELTNYGMESGAFFRVNQLRRLSLIGNKLTEFPAGLPSSLNALYLTHNQISYISIESLQELISLEILYLDRNKIHDGSFGNMGLKSLTNLRELEVSYNIITKIPARMSYTLQKLHITANQLQYLRKSELEGLYNLERLDVAYNRLKSIEFGSLEGLKSLERVDLSGNNWSCDCYLRDLKHYLRTKGVHHGAQDMVTCSDALHSNTLLDTIQETDLTCRDVKFNVTEFDSKIKIESESMDDEPPFSQYRLFYKQINGHNSSVTESVIVKPPIIYTIASNLKKGEWYQVCLYNSYVYRTVSDIPSSSCMNVEVHKSSNANPVVATPSQQTANYETIIGLVTGALIVLLILAIVTLLCWRNKRFIHEKKYQSPIVHRETDPRMMSNYTITTHSTGSTDYGIVPNRDGPQMTMDASKEFDVTLMLRQPDPEMIVKSLEYNNNTPPRYHTINSEQQNALPSDTNRSDEIGVFV